MQVTFTLKPGRLLALEEYQIKKTRGMSGMSLLGFILVLPIIASAMAFLLTEDESLRWERGFNALV
jgi:hypothetical protein